MENKTNVETLEEGFVESKSENPCNNIVQGADPDFLCNLSDKCVYSGHSGLNYDVELGRQISYGSIEESYVNNLINKETIDSIFDDTLLGLTNGSDRENNDVLDLERDLNFGWNDVIQMDMVDGPTGKSDDVSSSHELDSPTKIEVSGSGINLFAEVFGSLDGISDGNNDKGEHVSQESDLGQKIETLSPYGEEQCKFDVGDLVWAKTRSPLWWPAMISDPSIVAKSEKRGSFLVKYFGNPNFVWCPNSEMKPFLEYFESMSRQNNPRSFLGSIEKALCEFGRRVKSNLTCPCSSKESQMNKEEKSMRMTKTSKFDVSFSSQFEAVNFYAFIKNLARLSISVPGKIELTVMKSRLSAFYCSLGHHELPLHQLRSSSDDGDDKIASGKSLESRERKKSKYLSFPYIDALVGKEIEDVKLTSSPSTKSSPLSGKKSLKKVPQKPFKGRHVISKSDNINACPSELLSELCSMARDCFYLSRSDSLRTFYHSFRVFTFLEADIACKVANGHQSQKREKHIAQISTESEEKMGGVGVTKESVKIESSERDNLQEKGNGVFKKAKKKKEQVISVGPKSVSNSSITGLDITTKKRKVGPTHVLPHIETIGKLPNVSGNQPSVSFGDTSMNINGINQTVFGSVSSFNDAQMAAQNMNNGDEINGTNRDSESNMINNGLGPFVQMGPFPSGGKLERKKRKRKETPCQVDTNIPDLNGNVLENLPQGNYILSPVGKPELKSMRNKPATTETGSNLKPQRVFKKVEDPGGSLILNFAPDSTLPCKETLVKTFSRFGLLKESEIVVSDDLTVRIIYERSSDARFASRSLEKSKPFGETLVGFKLDGVPAVAAPRPKKSRKQLEMARPAGPVDAAKNLARPVETPDIALMRQNVEMMKMALEKAGNNLSGEMRGVLENEIKGFLDKISSMGGSSSSS